MKEENRKYAEEAYSIVRHAAEKIGSRLPGSDGERKFADYMGDKLKEIGITPTREEFAVSPRASIGGIPYAGCFGVAMRALVYFALGIHSIWFGMAPAGIVCLVCLVLSVFLSSHCLYLFFKQYIS